MTLLRILVVDDEKNIRATLRTTLLLWGHHVDVAASWQEASSLLASGVYDLVLTDYRLEELKGGAKTGIDLIRQASVVSHAKHSAPVTVLMTAFASFENAVSAIKAGAYDYLPKPFKNAQLEQLLNRVSVLIELKRENSLLKKSAEVEEFFKGLTSYSMVRLQEFVRSFAPLPLPLLIIGERGTGKSTLAQMIHSQSERTRFSLLTVHCNSLSEPKQLIEIFGSRGFLRSAHRGTLLLDDAGALSEAAQLQLLRYLETGKYIDPETQAPLVSDTRIIATITTSSDWIEPLVSHFNAGECSIVPLRHRREDLPVYIERLGPVSNPEIQKILMDYSWPGNVRELKNALDRLKLLSKNRASQVSDLPDAILMAQGMLSAPEIFQQSGSQRTLADIEREHIERVLQSEPNYDQAATILGITTVTLWRKRKHYGLP